jgi:hypothetical protein
MNYQFRIDGRNLTEEEHSVFSSFLMGVATKANTRLIYRGESIDNLKQKLGIKQHEDLFQRLNYFIFKIGEKGRVYQKQYFNNLKSKSVFSISDTGELFFKYIFNKISHVALKSKDPELIDFKKRNSNFIDYFKNKENLSDFVAKTKNLNKSEQLKVRDYYLAFLHRVGYLGFYLNTFMISTTLSKKIANKFTTKEDIVFVSWRSFEINKQSKLIKANHLPLHETLIFQRQKEVTLKGGLFPQDIIGFIQRKKNVFHVNPNMFKYPFLIDYMIANGIPTDQSDFNEVLSKTNYSGHFIDDGRRLTDSL